MEKKIYRSQKNKVIGGVCGGIGEYFDIDPVLIRLIFIILFFSFGIGFLGYIIACIIILENSLDNVSIEVYNDEKTIKRQKEKRTKVVGYILFGLCIFFILNLWFNINLKLSPEFLAIAIILIGLILIFKNN